MPYTSPLDSTETFLLSMGTNVPLIGPYVEICQKLLKENEMLQAQLDASVDLGLRVQQVISEEGPTL